MAAIVGVTALPSVARAHDAPRGDLTWASPVRALLASYCTPCHRRGGTSFSLVRYEEARPWAAAIREEVLARRMPPWPPAPGADLDEERALPPHQADAIAAWVDVGAPAGSTTPTRADALPRHAERPPSPSEQTIGLSGERAITTPSTLVGLTPHAPAGATVEVRLLRASGARETLIFIARFDPRYPFTYRLRTPRALVVGDRLEALAPASAALLISSSALPFARPRR